MFLDTSPDDLWYKFTVAREAAGRYLMNHATATYAISHCTSTPRGASAERPNASPHLNLSLRSARPSGPRPVPLDPSLSREWGALDELAANGAALFVVGPPTSFHDHPAQTKERR